MIDAVEKPVCCAAFIGVPLHKVCRFVLASVPGDCGKMTGSGVGMSDSIEQLSSRILAAMDRIAQGVDGLGAADTSNVDELKQALEDEQQVNAQLTERVRVLGERQEQAITALEAKASEATERVAALDLELQQLREANASLADACVALREANAAGVGEPHLINKAMMAELEAIRAMRSAEMAEAQEIISALTPLLTASAAAQSSEEAH